MENTKIMSKTNTIDDVVSVSLPRQLLQELKALSELMGISAEEAMRDAIGTTYYIQEQLKDGATIAVKQKDGKFYEIEWKNNPKSIASKHVKS